MICEDRIMESVPRITDIYHAYLRDQELSPLFLQGNALSILRQLPDASIDFCMTSPPYWNKRQYHNGGIGLEKEYQEYLSHLTTVFAQVKRVLKPTGSFWLNIGDSYQNKALLGIPWRIAITLTDEQGWILRNSVIWNKIKGGAGQYRRSIAQYSRKHLPLRQGSYRLLLQC